MIRGKVGRGENRERKRKREIERERKRERKLRERERDRDRQTDRQKKGHRDREGILIIRTYTPQYNLKKKSFLTNKDRLIECRKNNNFITQLSGPLD